MAERPRCTPHRPTNRVLYEYLRGWPATGRKTEEDDRVRNKGTSQQTTSQPRTRHMAQGSPAAQLLSPDDLSSHVQTCQVIFAMWGGEGELLMDESSEKALESLGKYLSLPIQKLGSEESIKVRDALPNSIEFALTVDPFTGTSTAGARKLTLGVSLPLRKTSPASSVPYSRPRLVLRQAEWLTRQQQEQLRKKSRIDQVTTEDQDDGASIVMTAVENISEAAVEMDEAGALAAANTDPSGNGSDTNLTPSSPDLSKYVFRTWHHLVSLSTKEKREDLVAYASSAVASAKPLTGFVLAGKPGLVVLEYPLPEETSDDGARTEAIKAARIAIDAYWSSIKSRSWADIPAVQKKVTETHREEYVQRAFFDMREMTGAEELGGKEAMRGGWRNDMSKVEQWLKTKGIGGRMRDVLGADW